jgi:rod shape-determining protein MreC
MNKKFKSNSSVKRKPYSNFLITFLFLLTFILILFNKTDYFVANKFKSLSLDFVNPLTTYISAPFSIINDIGKRISNIQNLEKNNLKLKEEIIRLKKWQTLAIKNSRENRVFKKLLDSTSHQVDIIKTASVINQSPGLYSRLITINAGLNFNVEEDLAIINEKGLVGKTIFSSKNNARVLLINDPSSSVPVKTLSDNSYSIISGTNNGHYLKSSFTKNNKLPNVGDLLVTSGNAKIFPRDILVARVVIVNDDHYLALPYVDFNNLNYVQIVKSK